MTFRGTCLRLQKNASVFLAIRAAHRALSWGEPVWRWCGPQTSFADPGDLIFPGTSGDETLWATGEVLDLSQDAVSHLLPLKQGRGALLWDKSFLWGYMAVKTLRDLDFSFDLLSAAQVRTGTMGGYQVVIVPGGWASFKSEELGTTGLKCLRRFVSMGGGYLGLCGGAGLALQVDEGLGLLPVARKPIGERLPNFSGSIRIRQTAAHPLWLGLPREVSFQVWWPSQFELLEPESIQVLGRYGQPESDFFVSDLNVHDAQTEGLDWQHLESDYEINLDPNLLLDEPALVEGKYDQGRVVLSYPHLETPGDVPGNLALFNVWHDLLATSLPAEGVQPPDLHGSPALRVSEKNLACLRQMAEEADELISMGERRGLWAWRNPWLLQWRRGVRGAEFGTVCILLRGLTEELERTRGAGNLASERSAQQLDSQIRQLQALWEPFRTKSQALLEAEARDLDGKMTTAGYTKAVRSLRTEIFSCVYCYGSKSYGGLYRQLLDNIDTLLFTALLAKPQ